LGRATAGEAVGVCVGEGVNVGEAVGVGEGVIVGVEEGVIVGVGESAAMLLLLITSPKPMRGITSFESYDRPIRQSEAGDRSSQDKVLWQFITG